MTESFYLYPHFGRSIKIFFATDSNCSAEPLTTTILQWARTKVEPSVEHTRTGPNRKHDLPEKARENRNGSRGNEEICETDTSPKRTQTRPQGRRGDAKLLQTEDDSPLICSQQLK
jgi:hypothetical protein